MYSATEPYRKRRKSPVPTAWPVLQGRVRQPLDRQSSTTSKGWSDYTGQDPSQAHDDHVTVVKPAIFLDLTAAAVVTDLGKREMARKIRCQDYCGSEAKGQLLLADYQREYLRMKASSRSSIKRILELSRFYGLSSCSDKPHLGNNPDKKSLCRLKGK